MFGEIWYFFLPVYDCLIYLFYYENKQAAQQQQWLLLQMAIAIKADRPATTKEISVISKLLAALCISLVFFFYILLYFFAFVFAAWKLTSSLLFSVGFISLLLGQLVAFVTFQFFLAGNAEFAQKPTENWHKNVLILSCFFPFFHPFTRAPKINILN